jgi:hypothetical protein
MFRNDDETVEKVETTVCPPKAIVSLKLSKKVVLSSESPSCGRVCWDASMA